MKKNELNRLNEKILQKSKFVEDLRSEISNTIVGQSDLIDKILISVISNGHILLEGVPGLAKTLTINTVASLINAKFKRIQFTPDMLPADLIGTLIFNQKNGEFVTKQGPIFSNIILADEINRSPSKVQNPPPRLPSASTFSPRSSSWRMSGSAASLPTVRTRCAAPTLPRRVSPPLSMI